MELGRYREGRREWLKINAMEKVFVVLLLEDGRIWHPLFLCMVWHWVVPLQFFLEIVPCLCCHTSRWFFELFGNYFDFCFFSFSPEAAQRVGCMVVPSINPAFHQFSLSFFIPPLF